MPVIGKPPKSPRRVFLLATPANLFQKLNWEIRGLAEKLSSQSADDFGSHLDASYYAFNAAVTAWHLTDWVWTYTDVASKEEIADRLGLDLSKCKSSIGRLKAFQEAMLQSSQALKICCEIANGSKHMEERNGSEILASVSWTTRHASAGELKAGDPIATFTYNLVVRDSENEFTALEVFKSVENFWQDFLSTWGFIDPEFIHPDEDEYL